MASRLLNKWIDETSDAIIAENESLPGRLTLEDIVAFTLFLSSDDNCKCTAQSFVVDGGWT